MNESERETFVLGVLHERESKLENFKFVLTQEIFAGQKVIERQIIEETRLGNKLKFHGKALNPLTGETMNEWTNAWDGVTSVEETKPSARYSHQRGSIDNSEPRNICQTQYNGMLGLRVDGMRTITLSDWLEETIKNKTLNEITIISKDNRQLVEVHAHLLKTTHTRWLLDPACGYMPVECSLDWESSGVNYHNVISGSKIQKVKDVWVPMQAEYRGHRSDMPDNTSRLDYSVSSFALGTIQTADLAPPIFLPGAEAIDRIEQTAYKITASGEKDFIPLYHQETGVVTTGKEKAGDAFNGAKDPFGARHPKPVAGAAGLVEASDRSQWILTGAVIATTALFVASAALAVRRRRMVKP